MHPEKYEESLSGMQLRSFSAVGGAYLHQLHHRIPVGLHLINSDEVSPVAGIIFELKKN
jgi:hypothetical protein